MKERLLNSSYIQPLYLLSLALALVGLGFAYQFTANEVLLVIDGEKKVVRTHARDVGSFLKDIKLDVDPEDHISASKTEPISNTMRIEVVSARDVLVSSAGKTQVVRSASRSPVNILSDGGIRVFPGDEIWIEGVKLVDPYENISMPAKYLHLESGRSFEFLVDNTLHNFRSSAPTIGLALLEAGVRLFEGDRVQPGIDESLEQGARVTIRRARPVIVKLADRDIPVQSAGDTVGEVLIDAGLSLSGMDYSVPDIEEAVPDDGLVRIVRVDEDLLVELEPVQFETAYQPVDTLELDQLQVENAGTYGVQAKRIRIRYEDGEEVNRTIEEAVTVVEPEPRVIGYGTKVVVRTLNTGSGTIEYWRAVPVYATSYSPCRLGIEGCNSTTASGTQVKRGTIGVIRSWFNLMRGWSVFVPGYGSGSIQDIGAGFSDRDWIDLGFTDEAYEAWHDWTTLYFLTPVPSPDQIPWILP
ncbi:MAG: ubiquitin-like domain-containing protein [Anaerolineales bacterium]|jgi:uncharacterized protein YabE (DUF348 family)